MVSKVRTIDFLPDIFRTKTNEQFLSASLDKLTQQPNTKRIQGYIGAKFGYGVKSSDSYIKEPSALRSTYQLEPSVVFTQSETNVPVDALTYPGLLEAMKLQGTAIDNHNTLFSNEFYSWDSFCELDKLVNFSRYYWLPYGPDAVTVTPEVNLLDATFGVMSNPNTFTFSQNQIKINSENPVLTLVRGSRYVFSVDQKSEFWIQTEPGLTGKSLTQGNLSTREIYGLQNNGQTTGSLVFDVPLADAQVDYIFPDGLSVDLATTKNWEDIEGKFLREVYSIDGLTDIAGKTIMFYGKPSWATGYIGNYYDVESFEGGEFESGKYTNLNTWSYKITLVGNPADPQIKLVEDVILPTDKNITIKYGEKYATRKFVRNAIREIILIPYITAPYDTLYYQDSSNPDKMGVIKLVDSTTQVLDVTSIVGSKSYESPNGIKFTNGLKVQFTGNIKPESYKFKQFYVEGVGSSIQLIPVTDLVVNEPFSTTVLVPFDIDAFDTTVFGESTTTLDDPDYIVINRASKDRNAWSRGNRWFHEDVINLSIEKNAMSPLSTAAFVKNTRAKRPIIEFQPNLKLFNHGVVSKRAVDFIDFTTTDAFNDCNGKTSYVPDGTSNLLFNGAKVIFANDKNPAVRNKIYVASFVSITGTSDPVISLSVVPDGDVAYLEQVQVTKGENYVGKTAWFDGATWNIGQQKDTINQPPKFDVFDDKGVSFGDKDFYGSSDFDGCTLFEYTAGSGVDDSILGFPIKYSSVNNLGDISFTVSINSQKFNYNENFKSKVGDVSVGFVHSYTTPTTFTRKIGWQPAVESSFQYQVFNYFGDGSISTFTCDIAAKTNDETLWNSIVVYVDNVRQSTDAYTATILANSTKIQLATAPAAGVTIDIMIYSNQASATGYYQIPSNLEHNPFNDELTTVNFGEIKGHYKSICNNIRNLSGAAFGPNNFRDLGDLTPYGTKLIQNSASIVPAGIFLRNKDASILNAIDYNATEYNKFKTLLADTINRKDFDPLQDSASILDAALIQITNTKSESNPFFWSDMLPMKDPTTTKVYNFSVGVSSTEFALSRQYDFSTANYYSILLYVTRIESGVAVTKQLVKDIDYVLTDSGSSVNVVSGLRAGDKLVIKEYHQTYGNFVPNTPTKLGLYPKFLPEVVLDDSYLTPTYFIKGHDGSYTKLYGEYLDGKLVDFRDRALFEFEMRIYNNIKVDAVIPVEYDDIFPSYFRTTEYTTSELKQLYHTCFLNWVGMNRIDYKTQYYLSTNEFTWNYTGSKTKTGEVITQGNWRGIYNSLYDTATPHITPWEMLGLSEKPSWWDARYGEAPYTSDNLLLWTDLASGIVYNNGSPYVNEKRKRNGLLDVIPVDSTGNLKSPFEVLVGEYDVNKFKADWVAGDVGPVEYSYLKSSSWPFDLMRIIALTKPAKFFALGLNLDRYKYSTEFDQYLVDNRKRKIMRSSDLYFYGTDNTSCTSSYTNWVVDYLNQYGLNGSTIIRDLFLNVDVRLSYRLAGFSDKDMLKFLLEKGSTDNLTASLMVPDESYSVLLYENEPSEMINYSSVIVQKTNTGFKVYGNSQTSAFFLMFKPLQNGNLNNVTVNNLSLQLYKDFTDTVLTIPYGTEFKTINELAMFILGYGKYLSKQGMLFNDIENGVELTWEQMVAEVMYWAQSGWEVGSTVNVNPCANQITIDRESLIVQPLTLVKQNYILNQNLIPIQLKDLSVYRKETLFSAKALNPGDSISYITAKLSNIEHLVIFNNTTSFNDLIYNPTTSLRQQRIYVKGSKTAEWNGTVDAAGFIINVNNVKEWVPNQKYTKGVIVTYKNKYWISQEIISPSPTFDSTKWAITDYDKIRTGLLPNASTRAAESINYYDTNRANLETDGDLLGFSLIGYRPRQFMTEADFDDVTQVNVYKNMLDVKGTSLAAKGLNGLSVHNNNISYDLYENWAVKTAEFGGILNHNYVEMALDQNKLVGNPSIVGLTNGEDALNTHQQVPLYNLTNYSRQVNDANIFTTFNSYEAKLPHAGYVNMDDVRATGYSISKIDDAIIYDVFKGDYLWVADNLNSWNVYSMSSLDGTLTKVFNNFNGTATLTFSKPHKLSIYDSIGILDFTADINGYYEIEAINDLSSVIVSMNLPSATATVDGNGLAFKMQYQRVGTARDIRFLPIVENEFSTYRVWVDKNTKGNWTVYERKSRYTNSNFTKTVSGYEYGTGMCHIEGVGYFVTDPEVNKLYQYRKTEDRFNLFKTYEPSGPAVRFGTAIAASDKFVVVSDSDPAAYNETGTSRIYIYKVTHDGSLPILSLEQVEEVISSRAGDALTISGDSNYLYINLMDYGMVAPYQLDRDFIYADIGVELASATVVGEKSFTVRHNRLSFIDEGKYVAFNNVGNETVYTVVTGKYDADSDSTIFYTVEPIKYTVTTGTKVYTASYHFSLVMVYTSTDYIVTLSENAIEGNTYFKVLGDKHTIPASSAAFPDFHNYAIASRSYNSGTGVTTFNIVGTLSSTYLSGTTATMTVEDLITEDQAVSSEFGYSLTTNYDGSKLFVGMPKWQYDSNHQEMGKVIVYDRLTTNYEVQTNGIPGSTYLVLLQYLPDPDARIYLNNRLLKKSEYLIAVNRVGIAGELVKAGDIVTVSTGRFVKYEQLASFENDTDMIPGEQYGFSLACNHDASELLVGSPYNLHTQDTQGAVYRHTNGEKRFGVKTGVLGANLTSPTYFYVNGYVVNAFRKIMFTGTVNYGSTSVTVSLEDAALLPSYGTLSFNKSSTGNIRSIAYTNVNRTTGVVTFSVPFPYSINFTSPDSSINAPLGNATNIATAINNTNITNVFAYPTEDGRLVIRLRDVNLNPINNKLNVGVLNGNDLYQMGFASAYTKTQIITNPHPQKATMFGYAVAFNEHNSFVVSAPLADRYTYTTFDFTDDSNYHNDTVFDNGFTKWVDGTPSAGAVYMYDYINTYDEALDANKIGNYYLAQTINDTVDTYNTTPKYGTSLVFSGYTVMIGNPEYNANSSRCRVVVYENAEKTQNWGIHREYSPVVDIDRIQQIQLFDNTTNETITSLDYFDPMSGKLLGVVSENLDFITSIDPAGYNSPNASKGNAKWGKEHVGMMWFNTSTTRFIDCHQTDIKYNSQRWGTVFPGSEVAVYTWIETSEHPTAYTGSGQLFDVEKYSVSFTTDSNSVVVPNYYYWVKNTNKLFTTAGKSLTDTVVQSYIANPQSSGIAYFAPLSRNAFGLYNAAEFIKGKTTNIHIGVSSGDNEVSKHEEFKLIRANYADDFLPGFPSKLKKVTPESLYDRLLDSLSGSDEKGLSVPDPYLPKLLQVGINARPRQSLFVNRFAALKNYFTFVNEVLAMYPIAEAGNATFLTTSAEFFNTMSYWSYTYWWATGYSSDTRASYEVQTFADLMTLPLANGLIAGVRANSSGNREVYVYSSGEWTRIGLENGTIVFSDKLWDYASNRIGYGDNYYDSEPYDIWPSNETRYILRAINEQLFVDELLEYRNKGLILMFEYIQGENIDNNNYLPWLTKTSFVDVKYNMRELTTNDKYRDDNIELLSGYLSEVKPYHVVIKEFTFAYNTTDVFNAGYTDFDLPASYNTTLSRYVSPALVNSNSNGIDTYMAGDTIWKDTTYTAWFNNFGVGLESSPDEIVAVVSKYFSMTATSLYVENARGLPAQGQIVIGSEIIGYDGVDRELGILQHLSRGLSNTTPVAHLPRENVYMTLPGVIVLDTGSRYTSAPTVTAYVDTTKYPAPRREAVLKAVMGLNRVIGVDVLDPGSGYVVTPQIVIENSYSLNFTNSNIDYTTNTITIANMDFTTGELVKITASTESAVWNSGYYYVRVISDTAGVIALYNSKSDAKKDLHRVRALSSIAGKESITYIIGVAALAVPNLSGNRVRSVADVIRFDRTSYQPKVVEWSTGQFWSSPVNTLGNDASSSESIYGTTALLSSLEGATFPVMGFDQDATSTLTVQYDNTDNGITVGQINGAKVYFYDEPESYVYGRNFIGSISDTTLTVTTWISGTISVGDTIYGADIAAGTTIVSLGSGTGHAGTYEVSLSQTVASSNMNNSGDAIIRVVKPNFVLDGVINEYSMFVEFAGVNYADGDEIVISGSTLGGVTGHNDAIIDIVAVNETGGIYLSNIYGTGVTNFAIYYAQPLNQFEGSGVIRLHYTANLASPVPYDASINYSMMLVEEPIEAGLSYRFEPASLVIYNGNIWRCIESNADSVFVPSKWEKLSSDDRRINALDRIAAYYQPTVGMIGKNMPQLVSGIAYPNNTYKGNEFAFEDQFPIDIELRDNAFSIRGLTVKDMVYANEQYLGAAESSDGTYIAVSSDLGENWELHRISDKQLNVTSITYSSDRYVVTCANTINPVMMSYDGINWITLGEYTPYDSTRFDISYFDTGALEVPTVEMYDSIIDPYGVSIMVGDNLVATSSDYAKWNETFSMTSRLVNKMNCVRYVNSGHYVGYIAVGRTDKIISGENTAAPVMSSYSMILTSVDGVEWVAQTPNLTNNVLLSIASNNKVIVIGGENGTMWYSVNGSTWIACSFLTPTNGVKITSITFGNNRFVAVGENGFIALSSDGALFAPVTNTTVPTETLTSVFFDQYTGRFVAMGENDTIVRSSNGIIWTDISYNVRKSADYEIVGEDFQLGYGPEELVAGVISDNLSMQVTTSPGASWDIDSMSQNEFKFNTGFNMVSFDAVLDSNNTVSFADAMRNPATLSVFIKDKVSGRATRIYEVSTANTPIEYTVNWVNRTITVSEPLSSTQELVVEVYGIGNGIQLITGNSLDYPLQFDPVTGDSYFALNINYKQLVTDPLVLINGNKLIYGQDYNVTYTSDFFFKIVFNEAYTDNDYIVFSIFDSTINSYNNTQYGYSFVETELFVGSGTNYTSTLEFTEANKVHAIVEKNGVRLDSTKYTLTINSTNTVLHLVGVTATSSDLIAVTIYNEANRLWLTTSSNLTMTVTPIEYVYNQEIAMIAVNFASSGQAYSQGNLVRIDGVNGASQLNGNTYYVIEVTKPNTTATHKYYRLFHDSALTNAVSGLTLGVYENGGCVWLESQSLTVNAPAAPYGFAPTMYTEGNRAWVTINGLRVDPKLVFFRENNKLSICAPMTINTDKVEVTAMCDGHTPDLVETKMIVDKKGERFVYNVNPNNRTWLTTSMNLSSDTIHVADVTKLVTHKVEYSTILTEMFTTLRYVYITSTTDIRSIKAVTVFNETTGLVIPSSQYKFAVQNGRHVLMFTGVNLDNVRVDLYLGDSVIIGTEQIMFTTADLTTNTISGIVRATKGTSIANHANYSVVYAINQFTRLGQEYDRVFWVDKTSKLPLQLSDSTAAKFLKQ